MSELKVNNIIVKTAVTTLVSLILFFILVVGSLTLFYPSSLAKASSSLGLEHISVYYYEKAYNKTQDINDLYNLLNKNISLKQNNKIIQNFETLYNNGSNKYYNFIEYINNYNLNTTNNLSLKMYLANEDARLKDRYVKALMQTDNQQKALDFAINDFLNEEFNNMQDYNKINYIVNTYLFSLTNQNANDEAYDVFYSYQYEDNQNINFFYQAFSYYNNIKAIYTQNYQVEATQQERLQLAVTANKLFEIANSLVLLDVKLQLAEDLQQVRLDMQSYLTHINQLNS
jgi:hypothetical protein